MNTPVETPSGFRPVPRTGVIFVMTEAARLLGLHRSNLYRKMGQLEMKESEDDNGE